MNKRWAFKYHIQTCPELPRTYKNRTELPRADHSCPKQSRAGQSYPELSRADRSCPELPGAVQSRTLAITLDKPFNSQIICYGSVIPESTKTYKRLPRATKNVHNILSMIWSQNLLLDHNCQELPGTAHSTTYVPSGRWHGAQAILTVILNFTVDDCSSKRGNESILKAILEKLYT